MSSPKDVVSAGWAAWTQHDLDGTMAKYTDDAVLVLPGMAPIEGKDAIRQAWSTFMTAFPDEAVTLHHIAEGTTVVTEWSSTATHTGPLPLPTGELLPPTGKSVSLGGVDIAEVDGELISRHAFYWDNAAFLQQLGLMPTPEAAGRL